MFRFSRLTVSLTSAVKYVIRVNELKLVDLSFKGRRRVFGAENSVSYFC